MQTSKVRLIAPYFGDAELVLTLTKDSVPEAKRLVNEFGDRVHDLTVKPHREKRSLTANAYFHALANKLAAALGYDNETMKQHLVRKYGTIADLDGFPVSIVLPKGAKPDGYYPYTMLMYSDEHFDHYLLYKQTSALDSHEFARLIDGTIEDCKEMGIETLPPAELERLYAQTDRVH